MPGLQIGTVIRDYENLSIESQNESIRLKEQLRDKAGKTLLFSHQQN